MAESKSKDDKKAKIAEKEAKTLPEKPTKKQKELNKSDKLEAKSAKTAAKQETLEQTGDKELQEAPKATAKAGKRSAKGLKEAKEKQEKLERQQSDDAAEEAEKKPKQQQNPPRTRLERRGKNYKKVAEQIEQGKTYSLAEAAELAVKTNPVKFDASVEVHIRLNVDPRQADQNVRDSVVLPAGTGKDIKVAVFAEADKVAQATKAGADIADSDALLERIEKGQLDFDVLITQPKLMPKLGKHARVLGPKGLMPNPKSGTVTDDIAKAVEEAKAGKVEYRVDSQSILHITCGKVSFGKDKIAKNLEAIFSSVKGNKPSSIKGAFVKSIYLTTSMGPSIAIEPSSI